MPAKPESTKLTDAVVGAAISRAKAENKRIAVWDGGNGGEKGFGVRITNTGATRYVFRYRADGRVDAKSQRELSLGAYPRLPISTARAAARKAKTDVQGGADPARNRSDVRKAETIDTAFPRWLETLKAVRKDDTLKEYTRQWEKYIRPALGGLPVHAITEVEVQRLHASMVKHPVMANRVRARLRTFFVWSERTKLRKLNDSPVAFVDPYPETEKERYLDDAEMKRIVAALAQAETVGLPVAPQLKAKARGATKARKSRAKVGARAYVLKKKRKLRGKYASQPDGAPERLTKANPTAVAAIRFLLITGWRESEALTLERSLVKYEKGGVDLRDTKTGPSWRPLSKSALAIVKAQPEVAGNKYVFCGAKDGQPLKEIRHLWYAVRHAAGLEKTRLHDIRHSFASKLASTGSSLPMIGAALGHKDVKSTKRYAKLYPEEIQSATERAALDILGVTEASNANSTEEG